MFRTLYVSLVYPQEYASEIWNPHLIGVIATSSGESAETHY